MKNHHIRTVAAAAIFQLLVRGSQSADTFIGPGVVDCEMGSCSFAVAPELGCSDPCHTSHRDHMYHFAFEDVSDVSSDFSLRGASNDGIDGDPCFHRHAEDIDAYYPDQIVEIKEGCTAQCTGECDLCSCWRAALQSKMSCSHHVHMNISGCTFAPTIEICECSLHMHVSLYLNKCTAKNTVLIQLVQRCSIASMAGAQNTRQTMTLIAVMR